MTSALKVVTAAMMLLATVTVAAQDCTPPPRPSRQHSPVSSKIARLFPLPGREEDQQRPAYIVGDDG